MEKNLERFLKSIDYNENLDVLNNAAVNKVVYIKKEDLYEVHIKNDIILPLDIVLSLIEKSSKGINQTDKCFIKFCYDEIKEDIVIDYINYLFNKLKSKKASLVSLNKEDLKIVDHEIIIDVSSKTEVEKLNNELKKLKKHLGDFGIEDYDIKINLNEELRKVVQDEMKADTTIQPVKEKSDIVLGKKINEDIELTKINDIIDKANNVVVEAYVFGIDTLERENINIITMKISDKSSSILAKIFKKDHDEFNDVIKEIKTDKWYRIQGNIEFDNYSHDLVMQVRNMEHIKDKNDVIVDDAEVKRVELHAHTMMSTMDSVVGIDLGKHTIDLVDFAVKMGHKAVAITDHNGCQAFPIAFQNVKGMNKGKDSADHFKCLYGTELSIVNDDVDIVFNKETGNYDLLNDEFVVFDTETTGFYVGKDQMIEIGAVKIKNGEITDTFDELIKPVNPIPKKITELTCITDEMVKDCDNEQNVTKRFLAWVKDAPMVAHNAKFDIGFIKSACAKYDLGEFKNVVCDTMGMARMLNPDWPNHKLSTLVKKYNVEWNEDEHHRADYDALGTAHCFHKMCKILYDRNIETTQDIVKDVNVDELVKFSVPFHVCVLAKNKAGLKNLFQIISLANTTYLFRNNEPKLPRNELVKHHDGLLIGSGCINGEIFEAAKTKEDEELSNMMQFYDYIEVQPISAMSHLLQMESSGFRSEIQLQEHIKKIIRVAKMAGKLVVATGDVHNLKSEDKIFREIIIRQKTNGKLHPLNRSGIDVPDMRFLTTNEMLEQFNFLDPEEAYEIVVTNTNKIAEMIEEIEVIKDTGGTPFSPRVKADDGASYLDCPKVVTDLVYEKAASWYGQNLPYNIEERISKELYGDIVFNACNTIIKEENDGLSDSEITTKTFEKLHGILVQGKDETISFLKEYFKNHWESEEELTADALDNRVKKELGGIIGGGFDPIYLIAQRLVKHSNDGGFLVGSRGSVGSSFVATMMGITEVNPLPAHYRCLNCQHSEFEDEEGNALGATYPCGFDLPDKKCPCCGKPLYKDGQDMPFATFLGFNADKVPDIDLNFSDLNQADAHQYTKVLFGVDNVYRAGTIGTVAEKTAFGFVKGYLEDNNITMRQTEIERLAIGCTGVKRTTGQHPGGIVVVPDYMDVSDFTPFQFPAEDPNSAWRTTHFDYHSIEECLLKLDILGHSDPTQLKILGDMTKTDVLKVPMDDKDTMSIFASTKVLGVKPEQIMCKTGILGIPEFGTPFSTVMVDEIKPKTFADLIKISGLSHGTDVWNGNARDLIINNIVPFSEVIGCRDDIMVYLMYHGVKPIKAFKIMEFVRKGKASKDPATWAEHKLTMQEAGIEDWFIDSCGKIKYMFPKAHAAAYVISAFRIAWYKVHMPVYFYASWLTCKATDVDLDVMIKGYDAIKQKIIEIQNKGYDATNKEAGQLESLRVCLEATARGITFAPLSISESNGTTWGVRDDKTIIPPFSAVDGLGETVATKIEQERKIKSFYSIEDFQNRGKVNQTTMDKLRLMNVFDGLPESSQLSLF
ncbi:MAG: PolC-type DNA polymerase III [Bacilli bacterium]|nr:PolC-type DNA polymerase III [Bacilli bacterium]